eukprot:15377849-Heterocapsa_arctica.AAC.1
MSQNGPTDHSRRGRENDDHQERFEDPFSRRLCHDSRLPCHLRTRQGAEEQRPCHLSLLCRDPGVCEDHGSRDK